MRGHYTCATAIAKTYRHRRLVADLEFMQKRASGNCKRCADRVQAFTSRERNEAKRID